MSIIEKIAVCLPSYNEANNISIITKKIDKALLKLDKKYDCVIINADNNSPDCTNKIFNNTVTIHKKYSLVTNEKGKGANILNFFKYCRANKILYAFMIDSDLKSFKIDWLSKMIKPLENNSSDFVCPLYKRTRYEGNTTNHFVLPIVYTLYGKFIRQPIAGDYAFNYKVIEVLEQHEDNKFIKLYGIDIFILITVIANQLKIKEVLLGKKIHAPSYNKMDNIFEEVVKGVIISYKTNKNILTLPNKFDSLKNNFIGISKNKKCTFLEEMIPKYNTALKKFNYKKECYEKIKKDWKSELVYFINNIEKINIDDLEYLNNLKKLFICRSISYWKEFSNKSEKKCELELKKQISVVFKEVKNEIVN